MARLTRDLILDTGLDILTSEGLRHLSVAELARRMGVVKSALYYHFPAGKGEIIDAVLMREEEAILRAAAAAIARTTGTRNRLAALARASAAHVMRIASLYPVADDAADQIQSYLVARRRSFLERERAIIAEVLRDGVAAGEVRSIDVDLVAAGLQGALHQAVRAFALRPGPTSANLLERLVETVFSGIGQKS